MENKKLKYRTDFLCPKNDFWIGMGTVLNLAGHYFEFNYSKSDRDADIKALTSDWENVGNDIRKSKESFVKKNSKKLCLK